MATSPRPGGSGVCASNPCLNVTGFQTSALYSAFTGTYNPAAATNNLTVSGVTGALAVGQLITDGGASLTGPPLLISGGSGTHLDRLRRLLPVDDHRRFDDGRDALDRHPQHDDRERRQSTPVQIVGYGSGSGGLGSYQLSSSANGAVGSSGSPVAFTLASIAAGGAIAPGPALTIADTGAGTMFAITNYPSASPTGAINLHGNLQHGEPRRDAVVDPGAIVRRRGRAGGRRLLMDGAHVAVDRWRENGRGRSPMCRPASTGSRSGPRTGPPTRRCATSSPSASCSTSPARAIWTWPNDITGALNTTISGIVSAHAMYGNQPIVPGPAFGKYRPWYAQAIPANRFTQQVSGVMSEGMTTLAQTFNNATGVGTGLINAVIVGTGSVVSMIGGQNQTQTLGIGDGSSMSWCSSSIYCANHANGALFYNLAGLTGATITGSVTTTGGVSTLTGSTMVAGAIEPGLTLTGAGSPARRR